MKAVRILFAGVIVSLFGMTVGMICCGGLFNWVYKLEPTNVWKPMEGAPGMMFYAGTLVLSIVLVLVYAMIHKGIPGKANLIKGGMFGLILWLVGILPGMFATYTFMTVATTVVIYWTILGLATNLVKGVIIAGMYGE